MNPGQVFSFNHAVGERTKEQGFLEVPVVLKDKVEPDIEAGVRQVATTLYKPVLLLGVKILERHISDYYTPAVFYCKQGLEASVETTSEDFKFKNTLDAPIMLEFEAHEGLLRSRILGLRELPYRVELRLGRLNKISYDTKIKKDPKLLRGLEVIDQIGIDGYSIKVFRTFFTRKGIKYKEELLYEKPDEYLARTAIVRIGTAKSTARQNMSDPSSISSDKSSVETSDRDLDFLQPLGFQGP